MPSKYQDKINSILEMKKNGGGVTFVTAPEFFPTPKLIVDIMLKELTRYSPCTILEPSAGSGNLVRGLFELKTVEKITTVEIDSELIKHLKKINSCGPNICDDFLALTPSDLGKYDAVVMNPPFRNNADIKHVMHAYNFINFGGVLVSVVSETAISGSRNAPKEFKEFIYSKGGFDDKLPEGSFKNSGTMANTRLVVIPKL